MINLGVHASKKNIVKYASYTNIFQVFLSTPYRMNLTGHYDETLFMQYPEAHFVIHGPYWTNFQVENRFLRQTVRLIRQHLEFCERHGIRYVVFHTGTQNRKIKEGKKLIPFSKEFVVDLLLPIVRNYPKVTMLLENSPSHRGKGMSVDKIINVVDDVRAKGVSNIGLCLDTLHAYAYGENMDRMSYFMKFADVIHFNSFPEEVGHGSCRDRHSETPLQDSKAFSPTLLISWLKIYVQKYKILEMRTEAALATFKWLSRIFNDEGKKNN